MYKGISLGFTHPMGIGDAIQFTSLPENYFKSTGQMLCDVSHHWVFDHNPYILRNKFTRDVTYLWKDLMKKDFPYPVYGHCFMSNSEIWAQKLKCKVVLKRPKLYYFENYPIHWRKQILIHPQGISLGKMPDYVIDHILSKYGSCDLAQIGLPDDLKIPGIPFIETKNFWELAEVVSKAKMLIGMDSGPSWVAACYPDVIVKKIRAIYPKQFEQRVPLERDKSDTHWDDLGLFKMYNTTKDDIGYTESFLRI